MQPLVVTTQATPSVSARRELVRLCAAGFLAYCSYAMCRSPLLPLFARQLGADARLTGVIVGASTLTGVVMKLPADASSDVVGRRVLLVTGAVVFAVMPFTYLAVSGVGLLIALRLMHGSATAIFGPVASASLSDIAPSHRRATWLSTYSRFQGAGQAIGPVLAGYLIAIAVWMIPSAEAAGPLVAAVLAYAAGVAVTTAATGAYVTDVAPRARYGAAHGVFGTIYDIGDAAGPILAGLLAAAWGYARMFHIIAMAAIIVAAAFFVFARTADVTTT